MRKRWYYWRYKRKVQHLKNLMAIRRVWLNSPVFHDIDAHIRAEQIATHDGYIHKRLRELEWDYGMRQYEETTLPNGYKFRVLNDRVEEL